jgi:transcriptional regulator with XRE-family HTH domain/DNA-directed RNA polymerase specialized sigma24 family protein
VATRHFYPHILDLEPIAQGLGRWITALRHDRNLNHAELARVTGLPVKYLAQVETENRRPQFSTFRRICRALGVSGGPLIQAVRDFYSDITADIDPASHTALGNWMVALRNDQEMSTTELARQIRIPRRSLSSIENNDYLPRLGKLRQLCRAQGISGELLLEIVERFYADRYERSGYRDEEELFKRYVLTRVGSPEEQAVKDEISKRFAWVPKAVARRMHPDIREEAEQVAWTGMLLAIGNHVPSASFAAHAWASCREAVRRYRLALRFPDLDDRTRRLVSTVNAQIDRMKAAGAPLENTEIARETGLTVHDVALAREILPPLPLEAPISGNDGSRHSVVADPVPVRPFSTDFERTVHAALEDMDDAATAERLVMLHLFEGLSLTRTAERLGLPTAAAADVRAEAVARLRHAFDDREPSDGTASEQNQSKPWSTASAEPDQPPIPPVSRGGSAQGEGAADQQEQRTRPRGPGGLIGSRPSSEPGGGAELRTTEVGPFDAGELGAVLAEHGGYDRPEGHIGSRPTDSTSEPTHYEPARPNAVHATREELAHWATQLSDDGLRTFLTRAQTETSAHIADLHRGQPPALEAAIAAARVQTALVIEQLNRGAAGGSGSLLAAADAASNVFEIIGALRVGDTPSASYRDSLDILSRTRRGAFPRGVQLGKTGRRIPRRRARQRLGSRGDPVAALATGTSSGIRCGT